MVEVNGNKQLYKLMTGKSNMKWVFRGVSSTRAQARILGTKTVTENRLSSTIIKGEKPKTAGNKRSNKDEYDDSHRGREGSNQKRDIFGDPLEEARIRPRHTGKGGGGSVSIDNESDADSNLVRSGNRGEDYRTGKTDAKGRKESQDDGHKTAGKDKKKGLLGVLENLEEETNPQARGKGSGKSSTKENGKVDREGVEGEGEDTQPKEGKNGPRLVGSEDTLRRATEGYVLPPLPQEQFSVQMEQKRALPVVQQETLYLQAIKQKRGLIPGRICDRCHLGQDCPKWQPAATCAYEESFQAFQSRDINEVLSAMDTIISDNMERLEFAKHSEKIANAGQISPDVTRLSEVVINQLSAKLELSREINKVTVTAVGTDAVQKKGPGILASLFGVKKETESQEILLQSPDVAKERGLLNEPSSSAAQELVVESVTGETISVRRD